MAYVCFLPTKGLEDPLHLLTVMLRTNLELDDIFFKKLAHAYFGRPYFSKFFGGKIEHF